MKTIAIARTLAMLALGAALSGTHAASGKKELEALMAKDGLQQVRVSNIDLVYARPGATLAPYKRVKLDPVKVAFSPAWNPNRTGSLTKLTTEEKEEIRARVARLVEDEFARELQSGGRYRLTTDSGPDVLRVQAGIVNLYVNAPDTGIGRSRTVVSSAGEMTLIAELTDSASGQVVARVADRREANSRIQVTNSFTNETEGRLIAASWAKALKKALDNAHQIGAR
jgi:hypothetical protein